MFFFAFYFGLNCRWIHLFLYYTSQGQSTYLCFVNGLRLRERKQTLIYGEFFFFFIWCDPFSEMMMRRLHWIFETKSAIERTDGSYEFWIARVTINNNFRAVCILLLFLSFTSCFFFRCFHSLLFSFRCFQALDLVSEIIMFRLCGLYRRLSLRQW